MFPFINTHTNSYCYFDTTCCNVVIVISWLVMTPNCTYSSGAPNDWLVYDELKVVFTFGSESKCNNSICFWTIQPSWRRWDAARLAPNIISFFYANTSNLTEPNHGAKERDKGRVVSGKTICTLPTHVCSCCGADVFCARPAVVVFSCQIILHNSLPKFTVTRNEKSIFNQSLLSVTYSAS